MKRGIYKLLSPYKFLVIVILGLFLIKSANAQIINEGFEETQWQAALAASSASGQVILPNVNTTSTMSYAPAPAASTALNTNANSGTWWYFRAGSNSVATSYTKADKVHSVTHSAKLSSSGYIITSLTSSAIVKVTFWASMGSPFVVGLATDPNATQPSYTTSNSIPVNFTNFSNSFPAAGNTTSMTSYAIVFTNVTGPVRIGFFNQGSQSTYIDDIVVTQPTGTSPNITTNTAIAGITNANVSGTIMPGTLPLLASGIIWSKTPLTGTASDTSLTTKTWDHPSATSNFTDLISPLVPGTFYYTEAYVVGLDNSVVFGNPLTFTTNPKTVPIVGLNITQILSNKAGATGTIIDSSGLIITEKGFIWNTAGNPSLTSNNGKLYEGSGSGSFSDFVKSLSPNTHYCIKAYAIDSVGTGYSADSCFTTGAAQPTLTAIPGTIDFGQNFYGGSPLILSYTLSGSMLNGGAITITAPAGFIIATSASGLGTVTGNTITITTANTSNYSGTSLAPTPIYVEMPTTTYGTFSGNIIHSGGGVTVPANADMVALTGSVVQSPIDVSSNGTDFWLGYGFEQKMQSKFSSSDSVDLEVYVSGIPGTVVTCETPLLSQPYSQTLAIPNTGVLIFKAFPRGTPTTDPFNSSGAPDVRLYYTGISNRGIHVYSHGGPISTWLYDYATNNSAGGSLVFPTNTWNSNYVVQAYGNTANYNGSGSPSSGPPNSYFFVIAMQDNTPVYFTPSVDILDSATSALMNDASNDVAGNILYKAGITDTIYLNKGQVFNAIGAENSSYFGLDLSGSVVSTDCDKKIAVFAGNSRCLVKTPMTCTTASQGSDNMIQQMIPSVAWDTKYLTVPTKSMEHNLYRIYVHSSTTQIWINDSTHSKPGALLSNSGTLTAGTTFNGYYQYVSLGSSGGYYSLETSFPMSIESSLPISVTEFIISNTCSASIAVTGNNGSGDPEMIILTGANQAINQATVYSPTIKDGSTGGQYINVVIPTSGVSSFKIANAAGIAMASVDTGSNSFTGAAYGSSAAISPVSNAFKPFPSNPGFSYARFRVGNGTAGIINSMSASTPFNSIAYGCASGESYGFNAGTQVKNLSSVQFTANPNGGDSSAAAVRTCVGNSVTLKIALPYLPSLVDSLVWNPQNDPRVSTPQGNGAITGAKQTPTGPAVYNGTIQVNGRTFYVYSSPVQYTFSQLGTYRFPVTAYGKFASDCPGEDIENMLVIVGHDQANLSYTASCGNPTVVFTTDTIPMAGTNIIKTIFDFGDGNQSINHSLDTSHTYGATQLYTAKVTTYNSVGCISTDSVQVDFAGGLVANYTKSTSTVCAGSSITFTDNSTASGISGTPNKWIWDYGDGSNLDSSSSTVSHQFNTAGKYGVKLTVKTTANCSDIYIDSVSIQGTPVAAFTATSACLGTSNTFTNISSVPNNLGSIDSAYWNFGDGTKDSTRGLASDTHIYATAGNYVTTLYVKSDGGCISIPVTQRDTSFALPVAGFKDSIDCASLLGYFTDTSNANGGTITEWDWDLNGDGTIDTVTHTANIVFQHPYPNGNGQTYKPTLTIKTLAGCSNTSPAGTGFTIGVAPAPNFTTDPGTFCMPAASVTFNNTTTISDGTTNQMSYTWHFGDGSATADSSVAASAPGAATHTYTSANTFTVSITAKSSKGCTATSATQFVTIHALPVAAITALSTVDCLNDSLAFSSNSTSGSITVNQWKWNFADHLSDVRQNPKHEWLNPGTYKVSLVETSTVGCISDSAFQQIVVDTLPQAIFSIYGIDCSTQTATLVNTSKGHGGVITEADWDFGDGSAVLKSLNDTVRHTYTNGNGKTYTIKLTVLTKDGCMHDTTQTFTIGASPVALFSPASTTGLCLPNASVTFDNTSSISDGNTNKLSYSWHFGDGSPDLSVASGNPPANETHIYTTANPDTVILTVTSKDGCTNAYSYILKTVQPQPVAVITAPATTCLNVATALAGNKADTISAWSWNYGDNTALGTTQAPSHAWTSANQYTINLVVTSSLGCKSNPTPATITVNALPTADFSVSNPDCAKYAVTYTDASTSGVAVTNWSWSFGDGTTDLTDQNPSHTYATATGYPVTLHVTDANGCSSKPDKTTQVTINPLPQPGVSVLPICMPGSSVTVNFTATNSSNATVNNTSGWQWIFDDGSIANGSPASYTYTSNGPHSLLLIGTSTAGCIDTLNFADTVYSSPVAQDSIINSSSLCSNLPVALLNESYVPGLSGYGSISKVEIYWNYTGNPNATPDVTDNSPAIGKQYTHPYTASDVNTNYTIRMNAYSGNGCPAAPADSLITVYGSPVARLALFAPVCQEAAAFILTQGSQVSNLSGTGSYSGLGVVGDSAFDPQIAGPGTFPIVYTFFTDQGCQDTAMQNIMVYPTPAVNYGGVQAVLPGDSITLKPISVTGTGLQYMWSPVAYLNNSRSATPVSKPADSITYTITVTSPGGCSASTTLLVQVLRDFTVPNTFTPNNDGINDKWGISQLPNYPISWVQVFDRYGQMVYESHGYGEAWDGTYKGSQLPSGTYYYIIEMNGMRSPKTGYVTILR